MSRGRYAPSSQLRARAQRGAVEQHALARAIAALRLDGFGGRCGEAAIEINRRVFADRGTFVAAANAFWLDRGRFFGHVAVAHRGAFWDADARPKPWEEIESWGMLAPDDPDYFTESEDPDRFDDDAASTVRRLALPNAQAVRNLLSGGRP